MTEFKNVKIRKPTIAPLTLKLAKRFCNMKAYPGDRRRVPLTSEVLAQDIRDGWAFPFVWYYTVIKGKEWRVNGQQSSTFLANNPEYIRKGMWVVLCEVKCESNRELMEAHSRMDAQELARSKTDAITSVLAVDKKAHVLSVFVRSRVISAINNLKPREERVKRTREKALTLLEADNKRLASDIEQLHSGRPERFKRYFGKAAVFTCMVQMYRLPEESHATVTKFWEDVRDGTAASPDALTRKLGDFLENASTEVRRRFSDRQAVSAHEIAYRIANTWNLYKEEGEYPKKKKLPRYSAEKDVPPILAVGEKEVDLTAEEGIPSRAKVVRKLAQTSQSVYAR